MWKNFFSIGILLGWWMVIAVPGANAHSGHSKPDNQEQKTEALAPAEEPLDAGSFYAVEDEETETPSSPFSRTELFSSDSIEQGRKEKEAVGHEAMSHPKHQVKLSHHELILPSQKDFKSAVGITLLAGALFGILSIKRKKD